MALKVAPEQLLTEPGDASPRLAHAIDHASHLLPAQGPITVFIHHNTLHAFEHLRFEDAVRRGAEVFGCQPYLTEERYRAELGRGRIRFDGLRWVLRDDLADRADDSVVGLCTRMDLRLAMLQYPVWSGRPVELDYHMAENHALRRVRGDVSAAARGRFVAEGRRWVMRDLRGRGGVGAPAWAGPLFHKFGADRIETWDDPTWEAFALEALWNVCLAGVGPLPPAAPPPPPPARHRDLLLRVAAADPDLWVNDLLVRFCATFLDQGVAEWPLPGREEGLYRCFLRMYGETGAPPARWLRGLPAEARRLLAGNVPAIDSARESLAALGVPAAEADEFLSATLLALRGWGGMVREIEARGDRVGHPIPAGSLTDFVAVRLVLDRLAAGHAAATELGFTGPLSELRDALRARLPADPPPTAAQRAFPVFQLAQVLGWAPAELSRLTRGEWALLVAEVEGFAGVERRRVFHLAYERRFRHQTLDAVILHWRNLRNDERGTMNDESKSKSDAVRDSSVIVPRSSLPKRPRFQVVTCLDEREESFRRHLEEVAPDCETFGAAGFFNVPIYYKGAADAYFVPLCPIVLTPGHWVEEQPCDGHEYAHRKQTRTRKAFGAASKGFHFGSRSAATGAVLTGLFGSLAAVPLVARILFPRLAARVGGWFGRSVFTRPATRLKLERQPDKAPAAEAGSVGFTVAEMAERAARLLRDIGLVDGFSRFFFILGHGSDSLNNPHKSAYDCGACGGSPGAPNGRALAQILNDPRVRARVAADGIAIPEDTWFVGGYHNTCDDTVTLFDLDRVPESHRADLARARADFDATCERNAHERSRRFMSAPLDQTVAEAHRHVENRSQDLAQVRPELGHATNAICIVGRRENTRGLYLDRRAFLTSYDPTQDDAQGSTLARLLGAAVPVCGGINLEYYFSHVDSMGYGCGTKLPHNVTGLVGVMDGAASDLRTGLPWQMTEIHEPVRLLFVVETTPAVIFGIMDRIPLVGTLIRNGWVQFAVQHPETGEVLLYNSKDGEFHPHAPSADELPRAATSADWYRGWRDHLEFAEIGA